MGQSGMWLTRGVALPVWYAVFLSGLVIAGALHAEHQGASILVWLATALGSMISLLALEIAGARLFARTDAEGAFLARQASTIVGYSARERASYLARAMGCWFSVGILLVVGFVAL